MYDYERISIIIKDIERYVKELDNMNINDVSDLEERRDYHAASMLLLTIINRIIDLASEIIDANDYGVASTYADLIRLLHKHKFISKKSQDQLVDLVKARNRLSHVYQDFTTEDVFSLIYDIAVVDEFILIVKKAIGKK